MKNSDVLNKLYGIRKNLDSSPFLRTLKNPYRMILPLLMRKTGISFEIDLELITGSPFKGILPEAVSTMLWRYGYFDYPTSVNILSHLPEGGVFIDVGAHFGYFSSLAASIVGRDGTVVSIEAMPDTFTYLKENMLSNTSEATKHTINKAAFNSETTLTFNDYGVVYSSLNSAFGIRNTKIRKSAVKSVRVETILLDKIVTEFDIKSVDVVKIDAESSEYFVLEGMKNILDKHSPVLIIELGDDGVDGTTKGSRDIVKLLKGYNYDPFELQNDGLVNVNDREQYGYCNLVFKPNT